MPCVQMCAHNMLLWARLKQSLVGQLWHNANKDEKTGRPSVGGQCPSPPGTHILAQAVCQQVEEALRPVYEATGYFQGTPRDQWVTAPADITCHFYEILAGWKTCLDIAAGTACQSF